MQPILTKFAHWGCQGHDGDAGQFLELLDGDHDKVKALNEKVFGYHGGLLCIDEI